MSERHVCPEGNSHPSALRTGRLIFKSGQLDQGSFSREDLPSQCRNTMLSLRKSLENAGASFADLVKLVVYYAGTAADEDRLLDLIAQDIGLDTRPVISLINNPRMSDVGPSVKIDAVAMRAPEGGTIDKQTWHLDFMPYLPTAFSHVIKADEMVFTSDVSARTPHGDVAHPADLPEQTSLMMKRLIRLLKVAGADISDVVKVSTYYLGSGTAEDWAAAATIRGAFFHDPGPAATGMPLSSFPHKGLETKICATAIRASTPSQMPVPRQYSWPKGHGGWTEVLPYKHGNKCEGVIHLGGQVALDSYANVLHPGDIVAQTQIAMDNVERVLHELGAKLDNVVQVTTFYQIPVAEEALRESRRIQSKAWAGKGPALTEIPMDNLVYENMVIEIDVIAVLD